MLLAEARTDGGGHVPGSRTRQDEFASFLQNPKAASDRIKVSNLSAKFSKYMEPQSQEATPRPAAHYERGLPAGCKTRIPL